MTFWRTRRWVIFALVVALLAWGAWLLGQWQFHRLRERRALNHTVARNLAAPPLPVADAVRVGHGVPDQRQWRLVTARGTYDDRHTIVLKYQTRDGAAGVDVVTPLRTEQGPAVLVDRGWKGTTNSGGERPRLPHATRGTVTVTGFLRQDGTGGAARISDLETRAVSSAEAARVLPYPVYGGFLQIASQSPPAHDGLTGTELPDDTSDGPHFFYGLQWWFFGVLAVTGFCYLLYDEWRRRRQGDVPEPPGSPARPGS